MRDDNSAQAGDFPGQRLGLPAEGPGSIAGVGRRLIGLVVDWALATGASWLLVHDGGTTLPLVTSAAFVVITSLGLIIFGSSPGHFIAGLHLRRVDGSPAGFWRPILRQVLLAIVLPAAVWDRDHRGGHDIIAQTVLRRR